MYLFLFASSPGITSNSSNFITIFSVNICRIWLYGYVSADQGGEVLLPHFINHYHQLGITYRRMLILVHHDPDRSRESLERIATICHGYMLECRFWEEPFSVEGQYREHLKMLKDFVYDPYDWILYANVNEFHDWEGNIKCVLLVVFSYSNKSVLLFCVLKKLFWWLIFMFGVFIQVCCGKGQQKESILYHRPICG